MPEEFARLFPHASELPLDTVALKLLLAAILGGVVALVARLGPRRSAEAAFPLSVSLVLLPVLVAMTTLVIADSIARAFGLVGALSIVRFRTVVEDVRDTVFIVFAVVAGMAVGAGHLGVCLVGVPLVSVLAIGLHAWGRTFRPPPCDRRLELRMGLGRDVERALADVGARHLVARRLVGAATARQGAATDYRFMVRLRDPATAARFVEELGAVEGVQSVDFGEA